MGKCESQNMRLDESTCLMRGRSQGRLGMVWHDFGK